MISGKHQDWLGRLLHRVHSNKIHGNLPKNAIVRFYSREVRDQFLASAKLKRQNGENMRRSIRVNDVLSNLYINENLTLHNKIIFKVTRDFAKTYGYKFVWVKNAKIFLRKDDQSHAKLIRSSSNLSLVQ
ncbi:hypothetical protein JTB14_035890 [Gonioctena quinquepunctata]|nr:hypothetical protein JTB14_035890 [Gonioctena quinquepunctata]